jgi:probable HAF family extracellular repeat protein
LLWLIHKSRPVFAQQPTATHETKPNRVEYTFKNLGAGGGSMSQALFINNQGSLGGFTITPGGFSHAFLWRHGSAKDLETLGGDNSVDFGSPNEFGQVAGESETSLRDPHGEDYCGFGTHLICRAFLWEPTSPRDGVMTPLPNLPGGTNAQALWINNHGEVAGASENSTIDSTCPGLSIAPQMYEFKPVLWHKAFPGGKMEITELPTPTGAPDGTVYTVSDRGHAIGSTGTCGAFTPLNFSSLITTNATLWKDGKVTVLKNFGGASGNIAFGINDFDEIVGVLDLPGDVNLRGFVWRNGQTSPLMPLDGDANSVALGINEEREIVGLSLDQDFNPRAVLWHDGEPIDLTTVATADSGIIPLTAEWINNRGEIAGFGLEPKSGELHAFLGIPHEYDNDSAQETGKKHKEISLSEELRTIIRKRMGADRHPSLPAQSH